MLNKFKISGFLMSLLFGLVILAGCSGDDESAGVNDNDTTSEPEGEPVVWSAATNIVEGTDFGNALVEMFDRWHEETNGEVTVETHWQSSLGGEEQVLQSLQTGDIEIGHVGLPLLAQYEEAWNVTDLPFIFENRDHFHAWASTDEAQDLFARFQEHGLWFNWAEIQGYRHFNLVDQGVESIEDIKGLTIRAMDNNVQMDTIQELGANPTTVSYTDLYNALNMGVADGWYGVYTGMQETASYETAPYVTELPMFSGIMSVILSENALDELSPSAAETVKEIYTEMLPEILEVAAQEDIDIGKQLKDEGNIEVNAIEDIEPFIKQVTPIWDEIAERYEGVGEQIELINSLK